MGNTPMEVARQILAKRKAKRNDEAELAKSTPFEVSSFSSEPTSIQDKLDDRQESARIQTQSDMALQKSKEQMQKSNLRPDQLQEKSDARAKQKQQMQMEFDRLLSEMLKDDISEEERKRLEMQAKKLQNDASEMLFELE